MDIPKEDVENNINGNGEKKATGEKLSFEEIINKIYKDVVYVLMPEREEMAQAFIETAIEISELYELDIKITKSLESISATYYFDGGMCMKYLLDIIKQADDISFFPDVKGYKLALCLEYYTHAKYRNGRKIRP